MLAVHPQEVLLHVVGTIERFHADVAHEGLVLAMDVLVPREEITPVRAVRAERTAVSFTARGRGGNGCHCGRILQ